MNIIEVNYIGNSQAILTMYDETTPEKPLLQCDAYVGKNGIHKQTEGDYKTPGGWYHFTMAFGLKGNPGTSLKYTKINENHYWSNSPYKYNQLVNAKQDSHICSGEHLIDYPDAYEYAIVLDYNEECALDKGSAIFLHCTVPGHHFTAGCIAVNRSVMLQILRTCDEQTSIWIHD